MGQLVMSFLGICLHVNKNAGLPAGVGHRIIAVDASNPPRDHWGQQPPHYCHFAAAPAVREALEEGGMPVGAPIGGWRMTLANAAPLRVDLNVPPPPPIPQASQGPTLDVVPRLETYSPGMKLRHDLLLAGPPARAAFFVDISTGGISANRFEEGGVYTTWSVETDGDPQLLFESREGQSMTIAIPSTPMSARLDFGVPGSLVLSNSPLDSGDDTFDFVLHYLAREGGIPPGLVGHFPGDPNGPQSSDIGMSTSCSNSQYP
ncbi:MAG TPA: hypothetical protein VJ901_13805 [Thermoanaerobaculia bacterium]|nr:hypothetical protein [Thermoanaerobaculia bacterium]